jgi:multidrug efflux pump subunit AcrA (membrane-fusion protein)
VSNERISKKGFSLGWLLCVFILLPFLQGCDFSAKSEAQPSARRSERPGGSTSVEVAIAKTEVLQEPIKNAGTPETQPVREVLLRAQVEGRLLSLLVNLGDAVKQGQIVARLDDSLLVTSVTQAQAELAALQSEVARAQNQVRDAQASAEQAKVELQQAQVDAARRQSLYSSGAIPQQQAELAQTAAATAQQKLSSATAKIATEQQAVEAAQGRVAAQKAVVAQARERQSYAIITSPISGIVLDKISEPGNLIQPGGEVLRIGDFSSVKVVAPVSDRELSNIREGQSVQVSLDAFPNEEFTGRVTRISPVADTLQIPVEITIPNSNGRIGSGLFARVNFASSTTTRAVVPETALQEAGEPGNRSSRGGAPVPALEQASNPKFNSPAKGIPPDKEGERGGIQNQKSSEATVFVVTGKGAEAKVQARRVQVGTRANGKVEILSGLQPGEQFVVKSSKPLKDGETVRFSVLSKTSEKQEPR